MDKAGDEADGLDQRRLEVLVKQGAGLRLQILVTAGIVAALVWPFVPAWWVLSWLAAAIGVRELRSLSLTRLLSRTELPIAERIRRAVWWNAAIGLVNGSAALFMLRLDTTHDALLTMVLVSWGAGGTATSATILAALVATGSFIFVPTALMWLLDANWRGLGIALLVMLFFGVQIRFGRRIGDTFVESYRIRQENLDLAERLAQARDAAEAANLAKSRFLAAASHDLRQPMQALALNSGELARCADLDTLQALAPDIARSIDDLRTMLDGLLELSSLDSHTIAVHARNVNLSSLMQGVVASFRAAAAAKGLELRWQCDAALASHTDPNLLRRVLSNLVDNAIKFTAKGQVELSAAANVHGIELRVRDSGPGIEVSAQEAIFDETVQLQNPERDPHKGYGLGLSIVRRLVALLGLRLALQSAPGAGSTFTLQLPAAASPAEAHDRVTAPRASLQGCKVLVLDDDVTVRGAYARILAASGCDVAVAATTAQAEALMPATSPQVALVDYRLRGGDDGFNAITRLRALYAPMVPLLCSADASPAIDAAAAAAGIKTLRKPLDEATLMHEIRLAWNASLAVQAARPASTSEVP